MLFLALAAQAALPAVDGTRLQPGSVCYAIARGETVMGATLQTVKATDADGAPAWDIVIHQRVGDKFDLRDHFVLRQRDLAPLAFDSRKAGVEHVRVAYGLGKLVTTRPGAAPVETPLAGPVWDGNLWGLTFAALPLAEGAHFELPFYQYDKGFGRFSLDVVGSEKMGERDAWVVEASPDGQRKIRYFIGKADNAELGYAGGGFAQRLGGDCSGIR
ncbi:hypothetical protein [Sphingomonas sp. Root241]|uniref:DUF3108 domain-containing protein n=1 Tax=Sphingomonas sp. Root241 TaxID=1736501 RepID=UPI0006FCDC2F|nr:hypothetical protein [Sphingomonas sp. Root241]KRC82176.1 hypothetical protein ASE13_07565 [Sphingomonas sp. Root241]